MSPCGVQVGSFHLQQVLRHEWKNDVDAVEDDVRRGDGPARRRRALLLVSEHLIWEHRRGKV